MRSPLAGLGRTARAVWPAPVTDRVDLGTRVAAVAAVLGLVGAVVFGALWWLAAHGPSAATAAERDDALLAARQIVVNLQSLDHNDVDKGLDTWQASATGPLLDELRRNRQQFADVVRKAQSSTRARVVDAAIADLDTGAGKARAIAAVDVTMTQAVNGTPGLPVTKQVRVQLELVRVPDAGWKAAAASAVPS